MLLMTIIALSTIVLLIGLLIWLRKNPERAMGADSMLLSVQPRFNNHVRMFSFETFFFGLLALGLALFERVEDTQGRITGLARTAQPNQTLILISSYLILCSVLFFIWPRRIGMVFFGIGALVLGLFNLSVAVAAQFFGARMRFLTTGELETLLNKQPFPWILMALSILLVLEGIRLIREYSKPDPVSPEGIVQNQGYTPNPNKRTRTNEH